MILLGLPIVSIVGSSGSGKTTFLQQLIPEMKDRGYKVAIIKHTYHDFEIDKPSEDSWKHRQAGAETVILSSQNRLAMIKELEQEENLDEIVSNYLNDNEIDLIITEGYKSGNKRKIEIYRQGSEPLFAMDETDVLAIIENQENEEAKFAVSQINKVADLIEDKIVNN